MKTTQLQAYLAAIEAPESEKQLFDRRLGLVVNVQEYQASSRMPRSWIGWSAKASNSLEFASWQGERFGFGAALNQHDRARRACVGEVAERYSGNAVPEQLLFSTAEKLRGQGVDVVDLQSFALYSQEQYRDPGFPFQPLMDSLEISWVIGMNLRTKQPVALPASMAYLNFHRGERLSEPALHALQYAGIATGQSVEHAEHFALAELFERDANTIWWASGAPAVRISDTQDFLDYHAIDGYDPVARKHSFPGELKVRLFSIPHQFGVPVVAAFIEDPVERLISYGTACRPKPREAAAKALVEAFAMLELTAEVADPESNHWKALNRGELPQQAFVPFREDRLYCNDFRGDYRDFVDLPMVAQLYLDPRMQAQPLDRLRPESHTDYPVTSFAEMPSIEGDWESVRASYLDILTRSGMECYSVDVSTSDVKKAGLSVVRVVAPGLYGNPPAAFPYLGGTRLYTIPQQLGMRDSVLTAEDLYPHPIPHV
ncbi:YcaO-like family protein [Psychromicrobium sp. YIM B11713]|uniref:YcaO-like family protein n=1 Tax=Psychromicrobium sp. YIM B11713 TaxID=3145233 RepID=UPI00374E34A8